MYQPPHFREDHREAQHALIRAQPLGLLIVNGAGGVTANAIPFVLDAAGGALGATGETGTLQCHVARANPVWRELETAADCLVVFQGAYHYITPSWYATKRETGKVVPTWNYTMVQCRGRARVIQDQDWIRRQIDTLTRQLEANRPEPWQVDDAPAPFIAAQLNGIVGIEIPIGQIDGKWKVSQNRSETDRAGVVAGLEQLETSHDAREMAVLVNQRRET